MSKAEQISAMLDGELPDDEVQRLLIDLEVEDQQSWSSYALVGDLMRSSELVDFHAPALLSKIEMVLETEPVVVAPRLQVSRVRQLESVFFSFLERKKLAVGVLAVCGMALLVHQFVPSVVHDSEFAKFGTPNTSKELNWAEWEEYLMAHQQFGGYRAIPSLASVVKSDPEHLTRVRTSDVVFSASEGNAWMNVWNKDLQQEIPVLRRLEQDPSTIKQP